MGAPTNGDLPADSRVGNTQHMGAEEQLQMHWGKEALGEVWKGHILTACGLLHGYAWVGVCDCQNLMILTLELDESFEIVNL